MNKIAIFAVLALALAGCQTAQPTLTVALQLEIAAPVAQPVTTMPVEWKALNRDELKKLATDLDKNQDPNYAVFVLTPQGFKNLAFNLNEMKRYIAEQKEVIRFYKKVNTRTGMAMRD